MEIGFTNPEYLWLALAIPLLISIHAASLHFLTRRAFIFSNFKAVARVLGSSQVLSKNTLPLFLRCIAMCAFILVASGVSLTAEVQKTDFDFVVAIDTSSSMLATDYQPNRLDAAKSSVDSFIDSLPSSETRVGLVYFGGVAQTAVPLTSDRTTVKTAVDALGTSTSGGTAIGDAITASANHLLASDKGRVILLITDGQSNAGVSPLDASAYAHENDVVINAVGVGSSEGGGFENLTAVSKLDEDTLRAVASITGGQYMKAGSSAELSSVFQQFLTSSGEVRYEDLCIYLTIFGIAILIIEWMLVNTKYRTLP